MLTFQKLHSHRFSLQQPQHHEPQRLSGVYQYHNAPEVLPEHGLEYDDNTYPVSDKYPVTSMDNYPSSFNAQQYREINKPPRIIFGMKMRSFLLVALVFVLIVVGAVVGGTVGRNASHAANAEAMAIAKSATTTTSASTTVLSTPTFVPLSACPSANNTIFVSTISNTSSLVGSVANSTTTPAGSAYTRYCDTNTPSDFKPLSSGFVYTFDDCIEMCATYSMYSTGSGSTTCNVAVYDVEQARPVNCVVGSTQNAATDGLGLGGGLAVALLKPST
ncbi:hypothetical protein M436DRAFT_58440 [Aureobasidium namibiae CBS 147.97]|uniref:Apple domain-containing protein n=1 Tax=Aureobasidium namibiae CBS 147.97 TaxID=1043004 RepID=A0A074W6C2_9PEZI|nr:uncharacterized protein M436DRAFT_58440 [Aureobasidium namibiae CBS 147.97]KEQ68448.1 hypothetical protein M436DRAFT_58440 [Aureobasidium namibiae CBS 147.97]